MALKFLGPNGGSTGTRTWSFNVVRQYRRVVAGSPYE